MEYKSPEDSLNIDTYYKTLAYACLYKAEETRVGDILEDEVTLTLVRDRKPVKLLKWLEDQGNSVCREYDGIYYVYGRTLFPTQVIVTSELSKEENRWLSSLTDRLDIEEAGFLVEDMTELKEKDDKEFADSVLGVAMAANKATFDKLKEDDSMCEALLELMKPELEAEKRAGSFMVYSNLIKKGLLSAEDAALDMGMDKEKFLSEMRDAGYPVTVSAEKKRPSRAR